jgi:hypothetical protein
MGYTYPVKALLAATIKLCRVAILLLPPAYVCLAMVSSAFSSDLIVCSRNMLSMHTALVINQPRGSTEAMFLSVPGPCGVVLNTRDGLQQPTSPLLGDLCTLYFPFRVHGGHDRCLLSWRNTTCLRPRMLQQTVDLSFSVLHITLKRLCTVRTQIFSRNPVEASAFT